jgi:hypothetical protein
MCYGGFTLNPGILLYRVLRRIFEPRRDEVTGDWRKLHKRGAS